MRRDRDMVRVYVDGRFVASLSAEYVRREERAGWPNSCYPVQSVYWESGAANNAVYIETNRKAA